MKHIKLLSLSLLLISGFISKAQSGALKGQILNDDKLPVFGATVKVLQGGALIGGAVTDEDGKYTYKPLNPGNYDLVISSMETQTKRLTNVYVSAEKTTYVDAAVSTNTLVEVVVEVYRAPVIDKSFMHIKEITAEDFSHLAINRGSVVDAVLSVTSEASQDPNGFLHVRGSRGDATAYYVDGVRSPGITGVAALSVENVSIITGGIPAQYGDISSGVIVVTTKDYFSGIQSKHMNDSYFTEKQERVKREKSAIAEEKKRKKEIEEELRLEEEAKAKKENSGK
ncbi:MAG: carboxypeptidase regulatory-like domain-containing protein [Bacteroidota bacterium]